MFNVNRILKNKNMNEELKKIAIQIDSSLLLIRQQLEELEQLKNELRKKADEN